jgi:hypothetical protein
MSQPACVWKNNAPLRRERSPRLAEFGEGLRLRDSGSGFRAVGRVGSRHAGSQVRIAEGFAAPI